MKCIVCGNELNKSRRKICPSCGSVTSLTKNKSIFAWSENDKNKIKELRNEYNKEQEMTLDQRLEELFEEHDEKENITKEIDSRLNESGSRNKKTTEQTDSEKKLIVIKEKKTEKFKERNNEKNVGLQLIGFGCLVALITGFYSDVLPLWTILLALGTAFGLFWFGGSVIKQNAKNK